MSNLLLESFKTAGVGGITKDYISEQREIIAKKWGNIGMLDGIEDANKKANIATLYENQLNWMVSKRDLLSESTVTAGSNGQFSTVAFPIVRRVFAKLLANDIVSVQAMNLPIGKLFFINPKVSKRKEAATFDGALQQRHYPVDGAYENAATQRPVSGLTRFETRSLYDAYYASLYNDFGDSLFDLSKGRVKPVTASATIVSGTVGVDKSIKVKIGGFAITEQGKLVGAQGTPMDTESFLASLKVFPTAALTAGAGYTQYNVSTGTTLPFQVAPQYYTKAIVNAAGEITLNVDVSYPGVDSTVAYSPLTGTAVGFTVVYNEYSTMEQDSEMAEVRFELEEITVSVQSRKLRANWTPELAQDVQAFQNIDAEQELTALLSEEIAAEIDNEIIRDLVKGAAWRLNWDYNGLRKQSTPYYGTQKDYNQTLMTQINKISSQIYKSTLRGGANWVIVSPEVSAVFDDLEYFHVSDASPESDSYNMGIEKAGSLSGRYTVYRSPNMPAGTILIGRKGTSILESGYIYAPYVPMELTPVMIDPRDFTPRRGIMTRYAKKMVNNKFYGTIRVDGLTFFNPSEWINY